MSAVLAASDKAAATRFVDDGIDSEASLNSSKRSRDSRSKYAEVVIGNGLEMATRCESESRAASMAG